MKINKRIKTICCECGKVVFDGPTKDGKVSHGYCREHYEIIMAFVRGEKIDDEIVAQIQTISH